MSRRDWTLYVEDILEAIGRIAHYTEQMDWEAFSADRKTIDAVVRNVTIIGEAARHIPEDVSTRYSDIPWAEMRAMRNVLVHAYYLVSVAILWQTVTEDLSPIVPQLCEVLEDNRT